jgi:hypothetical protein
MKVNPKTIFKQMVLEESGQILPWVATLVLFVGCGMGALTIDVGRAIVAQHLLQASADAAALGGAQALGAVLNPVQSTVLTQACKYGGQTGGGNCSTIGLNANQGLIPNAKMSSGYPALYCSSTVTAEGTGCVAVAGGGTANTVQVEETVTIQAWFGGVIGVPSITLNAASMASMKGSTAPYNVAVILDTTRSMTDTDGVTSSCSGQRIQCALRGALTLLGTLSPCPSGGSCGSVVSGTTNVSSPVDEVSIYTFPGLVSTTAATNDGNCGQTMVSPGQRGATISYYNTTPAPTYQITPYSSNYASGDPTSTNSGATDTNLATSSLLVQATGGKSGCGGLQAVGGASTYFAGVINQAQADLVQQYNARYANGTGQITQNIMIILSDGDAEAGSTDIANANASATYPGLFNECQQAVAAATSAQLAGTIVYAIAYGTQSSGCNTDQTGYKVSGHTNTSGSGLNPCQTMQQMASGPQFFYSDYVAGGNGTSNDPNCTGASGSDTSINDIFSAIGTNLSAPRLLPWGTT